MYTHIVKGVDGGTVIDVTGCRVQGQPGVSQIWIVQRTVQNELGNGHGTLLGEQLGDERSLTPSQDCGHFGMALPVQAVSGRNPPQDGFRIPHALQRFHALAIVRRSPTKTSKVHGVRLQAKIPHGFHETSTLLTILGLVPSQQMVDWNRRPSATVQQQDGKQFCWRWILVSC
jgi:hypothetical protein